MTMLSVTAVCVVMAGVCGALPARDTVQSRTADLRTIVTEITNAAESCRLQSVLQRVGRDGFNRVLAALPADQSSRLQAFVTEKLAAETSGRCVNGRREPTREPVPERTTGAPTRKPVPERTTEVPTREPVPERTTETPTREPIPEITREPARDANRDRKMSVVREMTAAARNCRLTAFIVRFGRVNVGRLLDSLPDEEGKRLEMFVRDSLARETGGTCGRGREETTR